MALNAEQEREDDGTAYLLHNLLLKQRNLRVHPRNVNVNLRTERKKYIGCWSVVRMLTVQTRGPEYNSHQLLMITEAFSQNVSKVIF